MRAEGNRRLIDQTSGLRANQITSYLIVDLWELLSQFIEIDILSQDSPHFTLNNMDGLFKIDITLH